jgi:hypothetical protein
MLLTDITKQVNATLAGEMLTYQELRPYLDKVIDKINTELDSCFPVFADLPNYTTEYSYFPDKYIRTVVVPGAAWHYYVMDEEGASAAPQFQMDYREGMFYMLRDYVEQVPVEYQNTIEQGMVHFNLEKQQGVAGIYINTVEGVD